MSAVYPSGFSVGLATSIREQVFETLKISSDGLTADEIASFIGRTILAVRPRVCELRKAGRIQKTGDKRANESGLMAHVWTVKA